MMASLTMIFLSVLIMALIGTPWIIARTISDTVDLLDKIYGKCKKGRCSCRGEKT